MKRTNTILGCLALALCACRGEGSGNDEASDEGESLPVEPSKDPDLQWKRAIQVERDLMRALELGSEELCMEVGVAPCVSQVHLVALGGHDPFGLGLYESVTAPLATTSIALDRVALSGCVKRAELDAAAGEAAVVFGAIDLAAQAPGVDDPASASMITELYRRLLARDPLAEEISTVAGLALDGEGNPVDAREFAVLACYTVATTTEFLFF